MKGPNPRTISVLAIAGIILGSLYIWRGHFGAFWRVPAQQHAEVALEAIAAVAAVVWTGGLISVQIRGNKMTVSLRAALDFLQFGYIAPLFALFVNQQQLRVLACIFFVLYADDLYGMFVSVNRTQRAISSAQASTTMAILMKPQIAEWTRTLQATFVYLFYSAVGLTQYAVSGVYTTQVAVAWTCAFGTFLGMQIMLLFLYGNKPIEPDEF